METPYQQPNEHITALFKSYYVVWKHINKTTMKKEYNGLNRTM